MSPAQRRLTRAAPVAADGFVSILTTVDGLRLHIRQRIDPAEQAPAWLLLHGLAVSHRYLMPTAAALPGSVYVPDLPGFGFSGDPAEALTAEQHADFVAAWMDEVHLGPILVLANSFGCQIAVELAIRRPDLVAALILVGPTVDPSAPTSGAQIRRWANDLLREDPRQATMILADLRDAGVRRILRTLKHAVAHHIEHRLPVVAAPIRVLRGQYDPIAPAEWVTRAAALAPAADTAEIPGAAHNAVTTAGALVAAQAVAFAAAVGRLAESPSDDRRMPLTHTTSAAQARRMVEQVLHDWNMTDQTDDVLLVTTELVENLTRHTDGGGELHLQRRPDAVVVEVTDTDPRPPTPRTPSPVVPGGRGLLIVAATARRWGNRPARWAGRAGKIVWAEIARRNHD